MSLPDILRGLLGGRPHPTPAPAPPPTPGGEAGVRVPIYAVNMARLAFGLPSLEDDPGLGGTAATWAATLAARGVLEHGDFSSRLWAVHPGAPIGEDIAAGQATPERAVAAWMAEPAHRAILRGDYDAAGLAYADGPAGRAWVADFAKLDR